MKTIITLLTTTMLVVGASNAMAFDRQSTDDALDSQISHQAARGLEGAYASARAPGEVRNSTFNVPSETDIQLQGR
jgi:hypothetical protein